MRSQKSSVSVVTRLCDVARVAYVVAYEEDTSQLEEALRQSGFVCEVVRKIYTDEEKKYSSIIRGMLTHRDAWGRIVHLNEPALVVEADFVPCCGFETLPLPHPEARKVWCWLYTGTSVAFELIDGRLMRGHAASPVATLISPELARDLIQFATQELEAIDPCEYVAWDSYVDYRLRSRHGWHTYLAYRSFGEHGGLGDPAHRLHGLSRTHRADCLAGSLMFLPEYARGSRWRFALVRAGAKGKALLRIFLLRRIDRGSFREALRHPRYLISLLSYEFRRLASYL